MTRHLLSLPFTGAAILLFALLLFLQGPQTAQGIGVPVYVTTANDTENGGGDGCSLREAIKAVNLNNVYNECDAVNSPGTDKIYFNDSVTQINLGSALPAITRGVIINGSIPSGRVELHGPGSGTGLYVQSTATSTSISNLVINNFDVGIFSEATGTTIRGNFIGTDKTGTVSKPDVHDGIQLLALGAVVGGPNGTTPGGACTGDCNLIAGNPQWGIFIGGAGGTLIQGNFIGTDISGQHAMANTYGIYSNGPNVQIGGTTAAERNVISGNNVGIALNASPDTVEGNFIGTDSSGMAAVPNGDGMQLTVTEGTGGTGGTIGGEDAGAGNLISGNTNHGIDGFGSTNVDVYGNVIGLAADGVSPLPNATCKCDGGAVVFRTTAANDRIGGTGAGQPNVIAGNDDNGVRICCGSPHVTIRGNSIYGNLGVGILVAPGANSDIAPPVITSASSAQVAGTATCSYCTVDVFSDSADEGRIYEGSVNVAGDGTWQLAGAFSGPNVTATATDGDSVAGYGTRNTSQFSTPFSIAATATPTPTPSPTVSPTVTTTPTPAATATRTPTKTASPTVTPTVLPSPTHTATKTPEPDSMLGDANCDGTIDMTDVVAILSDVGGVPPGAPCPNHADTDCSGGLDGDDALRVLAYLSDDPMTPPSGCAPVGSST